MKNIRELMDLSGRTALVTGGAGFIGKSMIETIAELGADVVVLDRNWTAANDVACATQEKFNVKAIALNVDLERTEDMLRIIPCLEDFTGRLDILINNAAFVGDSGLQGWVVPFEQQSVETWRRALEVNLTAAFALTQTCLQLLRQSPHGAVINTASIYGVVGPDMSLYENTSMGNPAAYAASKGGLIQLTRWLATALAPDIRVNAISPGGLERRQPKAFQDKFVMRTPLKRMGTEEDLKGVTAFLASDLSSYVTGQNILVDGGWSVW
jgi:NAD(P)-dependent dehydrogenase (short-subunit alcohol dehydrogenase family)